MPPDPDCVEKGIAGIELAAEHTAEFERGEVPVEALDVDLHGTRRLGVVLVARQLEKVAGLHQSIVEPDDGVYDALQAGALLALTLRLLRVVPYVGVLELALHLL